MEPSIQAAVEKLERAAQQGSVNDTLSAISQDSLSASNSRKFLDDVTTQLHRRGTLPTVLRSYIEQNHRKCDLNGDKHIDRDELNKLLKEDIYARSQSAAERQLLSVMHGNYKEINKSSNDDWGFEAGITLKDAVAYADKSSAEYRKNPGKYAAKSLNKTDFIDIPPITQRAASEEKFLPSAVKDVGMRHFKSLDANNNGYVDRDEINKFLGNPHFAGALSAEERGALAELGKKVEQVRGSNRDEWWYKDVKGVTMKDLVAYAGHQQKNLESFPTTPGDHERTITIGGVERKTNVHIPPGYDGSKPMPVVYAFHYFRGNGEKMAEYSKLNEKADAEKFIVVYPNAVGWFNKIPQWNLNNKPTYRVDEMAYVEQLMDKVDRDFNVDKSRVYVAGYSNGGMIAHEVATKFSNRIAAFASVAGCKTGQEPVPDRAVPALMIHGTKDWLVPYEGRRFTPLFPRMQPLDHAKEFWKSVNNVVQGKTEEPVPGVKKETFSSAKSDNAVVVYSLKGNGHGWPGSPISIDGNACTKVNGADLVWNFFSKHKK